MTMMGSIIKCVAVSWSLPTRPPYTDTIYQEDSSLMGKSCINSCISSPLPAQEVGAFAGYAESTQDGALPGLPIWPLPPNIPLALPHIYSLLPPHMHTHSYRHILLSLSLILSHASPTLQPSWMDRTLHVPSPLTQGSAFSSVKEQIVNIFSFWNITIAATLLPKAIREWAWLHSNKALLTDTKIWISYNVHGPYDIIDLFFPTIWIYIKTIFRSQATQKQAVGQTGSLGHSWRSPTTLGIRLQLTYVSNSFFQTVLEPSTPGTVLPWSQ